MAEQEAAYENGLRKLGCSAAAYGFGESSPDLRTDPAFAWRVLEAYLQKETSTDVLFTENRKLYIFQRWMKQPNVGTETVAKASLLTDALHAAVCELGKEE